VDTSGRVSFDVHPVLVLRPTCVPEKVGVTLKRRKSKIVFPLKLFQYFKNQRKGVKQKNESAQIQKFRKFTKGVNAKRRKTKPWCILFGNLPGETLKNSAETSPSSSTSELELPYRSGRFVGLLFVIRHISKQN
jgi:hypothetical protein